METLPEDKKDQGQEDIPEPLDRFLKAAILLLIMGIIVGVVAYLFFFSSNTHMD